MPISEAQIYKRLKLLGEGSFGKAYLVECVRDRTLCVIKQMDLQFMSEAEKQEAYKEARILSHLKHPNIINFREVYKTKKSKLCIVMDYADDGDLSKKIQADKDQSFIPESQILDWFTQLCLAVKHCHDRKIIHRDIKTQNIFMTKDNRIKLGDFGIAKVLNYTREKAKTLVGTPYYLAPEIIENKPYSFKGDIWSMGIVLYELCKKKQPFDADSLHLLALKIVKGSFEPIPNFYSKELRNLVNLMLTTNTEKRPTVYQILKLPIITNRIKNFLSETLKKQEFSHTILHNQNIFLNNQTFQFLNEGVTPKQNSIIQKIVSDNHKKVPSTPNNFCQKPTSPSLFPEIKKEVQQQIRIETPKILVRNQKVRKFSEEFENQLKLPEIKPNKIVNEKEKNNYQTDSNPPETRISDPAGKIRPESRFLIRQQKKELSQQRPSKFASESPQPNQEQVPIHPKRMDQNLKQEKNGQNQTLKENDNKSDENSINQKNKIKIHLNQQIMEAIIKKKIIATTSEDLVQKNRELQLKQQNQDESCNKVKVTQLQSKQNFETNQVYVESQNNKLMVPDDVNAQFFQQSLQRISEVSENKSQSLSVPGLEEDTIQSLYLKSQPSYQENQINDTEIFNLSKTETPLSHSLLIKKTQSTTNENQQISKANEENIETLSLSQMIRLKQISSDKSQKSQKSMVSNKSFKSDKSSDQELFPIQKNQQNDEDKQDKQEFKKSEKKMKIIYRDPFKQKQKKLETLSQNSKNSLKRQESDEELKTFLSELQYVINHVEIKDEQKEQKQDVPYILNTNGDETYDEDDSELDVLQKIPTKQMKQTISEEEDVKHTLDYITGNKEIKVSVLNQYFIFKHLKDQLYFRLGKNFEQIYKIAKDLSMKNEDLGCDDLKKHIQRIMPGIEDNAINSIATLMITLVVMNKGEIISSQGVLNY